MASIRKTKKRLKREIAQLYIDKFTKPLTTDDFWERLNIMYFINDQIDLLKEELQNLKRKKK